MKKALAVFLSLALVGSAAFAQEKVGDFLSLSSWGRALWDVAGTEGDDIVTGLHQSWGGPAPRVSLSAIGETDVVTFALDLFADGSEGISIGDNSYIEIRPFDGTNIPFKASLLVGKSDINEARRDSTYGLWSWDRIGSVNKESMEGFIFMDMLDVGIGTSVRLYPIEGLGIGRLTIGAALDFSGSSSSYEAVTYATDPNDSTTSGTTYVRTTTSEGGGEVGWKTLDYAWGNGNYYLSYALPAIGNNSIGAISVGYDSRKPGDGETWKTWGIIGAALEFTMIDNLYIGIGAKISTSKDDGSEGNEWGESGAPHQVNAYINYNFQDFIPLNLHVLFGSKILAADENTGKNDGFGFQVGLGVDYEVIENVPIFLDVRYANGVYMASDSSKNNDCFTLGVGISKIWANAELGVAFVMATNGYDPTSEHSAYHTNSSGEVVKDLTWAIPIKFEYSF